MNLKRMAAVAAANRVQEGMVVGLGTGSTVRYTIEKLGSRVQEGLDILGVPTSEATAEQARSLGIPLTTLEDHPEVDLTIDGADEVDPNLDLIKGMGGALFREKLVALASRRIIVVVDESKLVERLGQKTPVPVEVLPFGWNTTAQRLKDLGCEPILRRRGDEPFLTDNGNYILDCRFPPLEDPEGVARCLKEVPGVLEHGLFLSMAHEVLVGHHEGLMEMRRP